MEFNNILIGVENKISYITINRPKQLNALNSETIKELHNAITYSEADKEVRCILITGSGDKAFVAGADIKEFADFNIEEGAEQLGYKYNTDEGFVEINVEGSFDNLLGNINTIAKFDDKDKLVSGDLYNVTKNIRLSQTSPETLSRTRLL